MRNVFLALLTALVFLLGACSTSTPTLNQPTAEEPDPNNGSTDGGDTTDNGGDTGTTNNGGTNPTPTTPTPVYDPSLMKGFIDGYKGDKALTVRSLWIDQSNGQIVDLGTDKKARLETNGEFGVRLDEPAANALATLPLPIECGTLETTTIPAGLSEVKGALVPALFVFDGNQLVGLIIHGSYHLDKNGNIVPKAKLAMRVYSATDKIISKGECSATVEANALALNYDAIVNGLSSLGVNSPEINSVLGELALLGSPAVDVNLTVDVGLKKGWNTVVLGAELQNTPIMMAAVAEPVEPPAPTLNLTLADDTEPNFTWYYLDLTQFTSPESPVDECDSVIVSAVASEIPGECVEPQ